MNRKVAPTTWLCLLIVTAACCGLVNLPATFGQDQPAKRDFRIPLNQKVATPCGEKEIEISGEIQAQIRVKRDSEGGGSTIEADFNFGELAGQGSTSGVKYRANGTSHFDSSGQSKQEFNIVSNFALNKVESYDNVMAHVKLHISINPKKEVTVTAHEVTIDCGT